MDNKVYELKKLIAELTKDRGKVRCQYVIDVNIDKPLSVGGVNIKIIESLSS